MFLGESDPKTFYHLNRDRNVRIQLNTFVFLE